MPFALFFEYVRQNRVFFKTPSKFVSMSRPARAVQLVKTRSKQFPFSGWELMFGIYQWFYIERFNHLFGAGKIKRLKDFEAVIPQAIKNVPPLWKDEFYIGDWDNLAFSQIRRAASGRAMRFDKAVLTVLCLEQIIGDKIDIYNEIAISPAIFVLDGFSSVYRELDGARRRQLAVEIGQPEKFF